jgi:hypothetical protein
VWGKNGSESSTALNFNSLLAAVPNGPGVLGDGGGGTTAPGLGLVGTVDDGVAGFFTNNSQSGDETLIVYAQDTFSIPFLASNIANNGTCYVDATGNLNCTGAKHAVVPIDRGARKE